MSGTLEPDRSGRDRRHLAETLRELRNAAGLSGERLAVRAAMSQSKISRIESGKILPTVVDVERILRALAVQSEVAGDLLSIARTANIDYASWRSVARIGIWRKQAELKALAESSVTVRHFLPAIPSGLLQTAEYARATLTPHVEGRPARDVARAVAARVERQQVLRDESKQFWFLLTEQAVRWQRADPSTMTAQIHHMIEVSRLPNVELAIIPQDAPVGMAPLNTFVVYDDRLVLVELFSGEIALRDPKDISYHLNLFEHFWKHALTGDAARDFMRDHD